MSCSDSENQNEEKATKLATEAAEKGAKIICLQELFHAQYFPQTVESSKYALAKNDQAEMLQRMSMLAGKLQCILIVPYYEEAMPGLYFNSVLLYDIDGSKIGKYRKTHIPDGPQYHEKYYFTPGDMGYPIFETRYGKIAVGICWDEWFPEVARIFALQGAEIIFYPSAIGTEPEYPTYDSSIAWKTVITSHAITNGVFVAAVNRVGQENKMAFYGKSFIANPHGQVVCQAEGNDEVLIAEVDRKLIPDARNLLQFLRDRRVDTYHPLLKSMV